MIAEGNKVAVHSRSTGTDTRGFMPGMPATNKRYSMEAMDVVVLGDEGRFTEHYGVYDVASALMQLGLMPGPGGSPRAVTLSTDRAAAVRGCPGSRGG
jgi:hypothetical protein